jgi:serine/threonine protein kinase
MQKIVSVDYPPLVNSSSTSYTTSELAANVSTSSSAAPTLSPTKMLSPPIYSSRLSNLIQLLLSKNPRDRPTVNEILNIPWLKSRIPKWLSKRRIIEEVGLCKYTILIGDVAV